MKDKTWLFLRRQLSFKCIFDASALTAAKNGGITKIATVDFYQKSGLTQERTLDPELSNTRWLRSENQLKPDLQLPIEDIGFKIAAYPLTLLSAAVEAMEKSLAALKSGSYPQHISFDHLKDVVGFNKYYQEDERYS